MFERTIKLIGEDKLNLIKEKTIMLIGLGGVGGYTLETLVRSGITNLILIDYDIIDKTNLLEKQLLELLKMSCACCGLTAIITVSACSITYFISE